MKPRGDGVCYPDSLPDQLLASQPSVKNYYLSNLAVRVLNCGSVCLRDRVKGLARQGWVVDLAPTGLRYVIKPNQTKK